MERPILGLQFWTMSEDYLRRCMRDVAKERIEHLSQDARNQGLEMVDLVLKLWQHEQADANGMVEVSASSTGLLGDLARGKPKRVPVDSVQPYQCAGPGIRCDFDLFAKLEHEKYPRVDRVVEVLGSSIVTALLLERDSASMPLESLAHAMRLLWIDLFYRAEEFSRALRAQDQRVAEQQAKRRYAAERGGQERARVAATQHAEWAAIANDAFASKPTSSYKMVARQVRKTLLDRGYTARNADPGKRLPSESRIEDVLQAKKVKDIALDALARRSRRK